MNGLFITGTDTDVGKTYIGSRLAQYLYRQEVSIQPRKPVETGCKMIDGVLIPADATLYHLAVNESVALDAICPFRYKLAASPAEASVREKKSISVENLYHACNLTKESFFLVEGAGGFYSPIARDGLNSDLAIRLGLSVLIVAADRLGAINQTLLTVEAVQKSGLHVIAIILNRTRKSNPDFDNLNALKALLEIPVHRVTFNMNEKKLRDVFQRLALN